MIQARNEVPVSYAVELFSLGQDMHDAGIESIPCRVPCIERGGLLIPTMEGTKGKYSMYPFTIGVASYDETGGGVAKLAPGLTTQDTVPLIGLPIYKPDEMPHDALETLVSQRVGFAVLSGEFGVETDIDTPDGRERYVGTTALYGILANGDRQPLAYEAEPAGFYMGLLKNVGTAKLQNILAQQRTEAAQLADLSALTRA